MPTLPLSSRPLDLIYTIFFAIHIPASLLVDFQSFYPAYAVPSFAKWLLNFYLKQSNDPLIGPVSGNSPDFHLWWFKSFLALELLFQFPVFFLGIRGLLAGSKKIYVLLLIYGASTATTTLACVATVLTAPSTSDTSDPSSPHFGASGLVFEQRLMLLSSYIPFFLVPLLMTIDMALRLQKLVNLSPTTHVEGKKRQ